LDRQRVKIQPPVPGDLTYANHGSAVSNLKSQHGIQCHYTEKVKFLFLGNKGQIKGKGIKKVVTFHVLTAYRWRRGKAPLIHNLGYYMKWSG
jgi:hypothetical protein